jgi:methionyl-tRNA formyltransferase
MSIPKFAFFGTPDIAVIVLEELKKADMMPSVIVTNPDAPQGRKMMLTPSPVKVWALREGVPVLCPQSLRTDDTVETYLREHDIELAVVVAYGKVIPESLLSVPKYGLVNVHPSLLPRFRGASPIRSAILADERETGVSIMLLDSKVDHGPLLAQERADIPEDVWPMRGRELDTLLAKHGGELLVRTLPRYVSGELTPTPQEHDKATYCEKITKEMGELDLHADPYTNLLKIRAFDGWPGTFFFTEKGGKRIRVKVTDAEIAEDGSLRILRVIPEGRNEMDYEDFMR